MQSFNYFTHSIKQRPSGIAMKSTNENFAHILTIRYAVYTLVY